MKENIRNLKKRKKDPMILICEEIEAQNGVKWKKRKLDEEVIRRNRELEEKREAEKQKRLEKAKRKKEELLERIRRKNNIKIEKNIEWIRKKQNMWRKYRESIGLNSEDEEDLKRELVAQIPERKPKLGENKKIEFGSPGLESKVNSEPPKIETKTELSLIENTQTEHLKLSLTERIPEIDKMKEISQSMMKKIETHDKKKMIKRMMMKIWSMMKK